MNSNVYRLQPDENGEGGETWRAFATDQSMQLNEAERTIATLAAERAALVTERDELKRESDIWEKSSLLSILNELKQAEQERDALVTALEAAKELTHPDQPMTLTTAQIRVIMDTALAAVRGDPVEDK